MPAVNRGMVGNLPSDVTSFVGRRRELTEVKRLLEGSRLVMLTGVGGTGKTRLALQVAAQLRRTFPDGVWFVDLSQLRGPGHGEAVPSPDVLAYLAGATLGLREQGTGPPLQLVADQLIGRNTLLVLDNCEHLLPACAVLAEALLRACPGLRILATSREPLTIFGEVIFPVLPLPAPDPWERPSLSELSRCDAVALFLSRAEAAVPGFVLTEQNQVAVAELCHRLDGLPLAIELAVPRLRVLSPQQILDRLANRFALLNRGARTAPQRQQTLRACVDWSFELCSKPEQRLWARLSVFAGSFELDAVEGVCTDDALPADDLLDLLAALVDKSILARDDKGAGVRYRMLETIRDYSQEKLREAGEEVTLRRRHRDWYLELVARARDKWISDQQGYWLSRLSREHPNLRTAMEYCLTEPGQADTALRLLVRLPVLYWRLRGLFSEGRRWLDRALAQTHEATALRARALLLAGHLATAQGDFRSGLRLLDDGQHLAERLDAPTELAFALLARGIATMFHNDLSLAINSFQQGLAALSRAPERDLDLQLDLLNVLAVAAGLAGDQERATACQDEMLALTEPCGEGFYRSRAMFNRGLAAWRQGNLSESAEQVLQSLRLKQAQRSDDWFGVALCFEVLAWTAASQQAYRRAATLLGAAESVWSDIGAPIASLQHFFGYHTTCEQQARDALGDAAFQQALRDGRTLPFEDDLAYALDQPRHPSPRPADPATPLTRRERQIADLIAQGLSNKEIAATLVISQRTAESHVQHILVKLGFTSRAQVVAWLTT